MQESRNNIKTRMLKNAARAWGSRETEAENNFDPLIAMLFSSCSIELEKISSEVHSSRARVLERLVQLLSPDVLAGALPAHAIACALPVENSTELSAEAQFYTQRKHSVLTSNEDPVWNDIFFTPTSSFRLNKASIRYMAAGNLLYKINNPISKEVVAHSNTGKELPSSTIWLGIDEPMVSLNDSQFYFDFRNEADKQLFYHHLPKARWYIGNELLQHTPGYNVKDICGEHLDVKNILSQDYDLSGKIKKHINAFYKSSFITLHDEQEITRQEEGDAATSDLISQAFNNRESKLFQQPLRWIAIKFSDTISNQLLQDVACTMNCFPVMNSRLHNINYRLQEIINIVPLQTDDLFLDLQEVSDDEGKTLNIRSVGGEDDSIAVLMRNGGIGRFDERDAGGLVDYLLQLLRDDSAAFSALGNDFMQSEMKQLQQSINKLEQQLFNRQLHREQIPYLIIRNNQKKHLNNLFIRFWSTNGKEANYIKAGTNLQLYNGGLLVNNGAVLVTTTQGGRNKLNSTESVLTYKSALLSKDRIVTPEDIKAFCHHQLGERVKQITIQKGVMVHPDQQQGFLKTIDVYIEVHKKAFEHMEESDELVFWTDSVRMLLEEKSFALMPYRIFLNKAA